MRNSAVSRPRTRAGPGNHRVRVYGLPTFFLRYRALAHFCIAHRKVGKPRAARKKSGQALPCGFEKRTNRLILFPGRAVRRAQNLLSRACFPGTQNEAEWARPGRGFLSSLLFVMVLKNDRGRVAVGLEKKAARCAGRHPGTFSCPEKSNFSRGLLWKDVLG